MPLVVSDTSCITTLLKAGRENILRNLFETIVIPPAVFQELNAFHQALPEWIIQKQTPVSPSIGAVNLGSGESQAIDLAIALKANLFLSDDLMARAAALRLGLNCMGVIGILIKAKRAGLFESVGRELERVERLGGLYVTEELKRHALIAAGEAH